MMNRLFYWIIVNPVKVLTLIAALTAGLGWAALSIGFSTDLQEMLPADDESVVNFVEMSKSYGSQDYLLVAVHHPQTVFNAQTLKKIWTLTEALEALPEEWVEQVRSFFNAEIIQGDENSLQIRPAAQTLPQTPEQIEAFRKTVLQERILNRLLLSKDERTTLIILEERPEIINSDEAIKMTEAVEALIGPYQSPERILLSGGPYIMAQVRKAMIRDLRTLTPIALALLLLILLFSFRQLRGMLLPVAVAGLSVVWTIGVMALMGFKLTIVSVVVPVILLAIADADSIHILTRYQEALHRYASKRRALLRTLKGLNQPVIYTSISSAVGFLGVATAYSVIVREFGLSASLGILFAMVISLTFLPAMLALLPAQTTQHLARRPKRWITSRHTDDGKQSRVWVRAALAVFALSLLGTSRIEINNNPLDYVRPDLPMVQAAHFIEDTFGGSLTLRVSLDTHHADGWKDPQWLERVQGFQEYAETLPHLGVSTSLVDVVREVNATLHADDPRYDVIPNDIRTVAQSLLLLEFGGDAGLDTLVKSDYSEGQITINAESLPLKLLSPLIDQLHRYLDIHFPNTRYTITGQPMFGLRLGQTLIPSQVTSLALSLLLVWVMLLMLTRSLRLSLISVVPLIFSITVMFGVMGFLGIAIDIGTVMVASVAIGVGVDFAIHFISQYQRARKRLDPEAAIQEARDLTWRALLYNTLSLGLGFSVMVFSQFTANIAFGGLMALTVSLAFISSMQLVPALLLLTSKVKSFKGVYLFKGLYFLLK